MRHFDNTPSGLAREFVDLKLHACIFQYDVCTEMIRLVRNKPTGFALAASLKGLILRLYEYDNFVNTSFPPRLISLADTRGVRFDQTTVKLAGAEWKEEFKKRRRWSSARNQVAGHYGKDLRNQIALPRSIDPGEIMGVAKAFLTFNMALLIGLRDVGKGIRQ